MASINGRYVKIESVNGKPLDGENIGVALDWKEQSDCR